MDPSPPMLPPDLPYRTPWREPEPLNLPACMEEVSLCPKCGKLHAFAVMGCDEDDDDTPLYVEAKTA